MADKTIIDEIRARHNFDIGKLKVHRYNQSDRMHKDRSTLLSILAEIGALPDEWEEDANCRYPIDALGCAHSLETILKRTNQGGD